MLLPSFQDSQSLRDNGLRECSCLSQIRCVSLIAAAGHPGRHYHVLCLSMHTKFGFLFPGPTVFTRLWSSSVSFFCTARFGTCSNVSTKPYVFWKANFTVVLVLTCARVAPIIGHHAPVTSPEGDGPRRIFPLRAQRTRDSAAASADSTINAPFSVDIS